MQRGYGDNGSIHVEVHAVALRRKDRQIVFDRLRFNRGTIKPRTILKKKRDPFNSAIRQIEVALSRYFGLSAIVKDLPNRANLTTELRDFIAIEDFSNASFEKLHPWLRSFFGARDLRVPVSRFDTTAIVSAAEEILEMLDGEHRGRPTDEAFIELLKDLRRTFRGSYNKEKGSGNWLELLPVGTEEKNPAESLKAGYTRGQRTKRGAKRMIARAERGAARDELEFIRSVLKIADIPCPKNLADRLKAIVQPPQNRVEHLNRIAKKVEKKRTNAPDSTVE